MATPKRDNARVARILVDAALLGDRKACGKHGITDRTLRNYRRALLTDTELSALYAELSAQAVNQAWATELDRTLAVGIRKMAELIESANKLSQLDSVRLAVQGLAEIAITKEVLNAGAEEPNEGAEASGKADQDSTTAHLN